MTESTSTRPGASPDPVRAAFVYPNPRRRLLADVASRRAADTGLWGQNHLAEHGIDAFVHEPRLRRRERRGGLRHRLTWNLREFTLPWELDDVDVVCTALGTIFPLAARVRRRPRVLLLSYHLVATYDRSSPLRRQVLRAAIRSAAVVACVSRAARERLHERVGGASSRMHVVPLGVDERFWTPAAPAPEGYVLTVGRDLARDYETFLQALEPLRRQAIVVAGPANIRGLRLPANVDVRLDVSLEEVRSLYRGAACVVVPIRREGYRYGTENSGTIALLEAMASGRAAIVTERQPLADYVAPGATALTVPPEDPAALRDALTRVLEDGALAARLARAARHTVEERFTTRHLAARLAPLLREAAA